MPKKHDRKTSERQEVEEWELEMIKKVCRSFRTWEPEELQAELARKLLELKSRRLSGIRNWPAYVARFLYNKASNSVRDARARKRKEAVLITTSDLMYDDWAMHDPCFLEDYDSRLIFEDLWADLDDDLRRCWELLVEEGGNRTIVARRLGKHRNTVRLWTRKIAQTLQRHGFHSS